MTGQKTRIRISPAVAAYVKPDAGTEIKLKGLESAGGMPPADRVVLLFCLLRDRDKTISNAASELFAALDERTLAAFLEQADIHPAILDMIARKHSRKISILLKLMDCETIDEGTSTFLEEQIGVLTQSAIDIDSLLTEDIFAPFEEARDGEHGATDTGEDAASGDGEEYLSKFKMVQLMGIGEKIKMALTGDKEWRSILVKDANKLVSGGVIKNPRITDGEILTILKVGVQNDEIIRLICANKEWSKNYAIRKALIENPKTPLPNALRYLATMNDKDVAAYAKSRNISSVIATQAKRMTLAKKR